MLFWQLSTHSNRRSQKGCSIGGRGVRGRWSKAPCHERRHSRRPNPTTAGRRGRIAGRCPTEAGGPTAGPDGSPEPGGREWWPGCGPWSCPALTWARPGSKYLKCTNASSIIHKKTQLSGLNVHRILIFTQIIILSHPETYCWVGKAVFGYDYWYTVRLLLPLITTFRTELSKIIIITFIHNTLKLQYPLKRTLGVSQPQAEL